MSEQQDSGCIPSSQISAVQEYLQRKENREIGFTDLSFEYKTKLAQIVKSLDMVSKEAETYKKELEEVKALNEELATKNKEQQEVFERESSDLKQKYNTGASKLKKLKEKSEDIIKRLAEEREKEQKEKHSEVNFLREENKRMMERIGILQKEKQTLQRRIEEMEINRISTLLKKKDVRDMSAQTDEEEKPPMPVMEEKGVETSVLSVSSKASTEQSSQRTTPKSASSTKSSGRKQQMVNNEILAKYSPPQPQTLQTLQPQLEIGSSTFEPKIDFRKDEQFIMETPLPFLKLPTPEERKIINDILQTREKKAPQEHRDQVNRTPRSLEKKSPLLNYISTPQSKAPSQNQSPNSTMSRGINRNVDDSDLMNLMQRSDKIKKESPHKLPSKHILIFPDSSSSFDKDCLPEQPRAPPKPETLGKKPEEDYSYSTSFLTETSLYSDDEDDTEVYDEDSLLNVVKALEEQQTLRQSVATSVTSSYDLSDSLTSTDRLWFEK